MKIFNKKIFALLVLVVSVATISTVSNASDTKDIDIKNDIVVNENIIEVANKNWELYLNMFSDKNPEDFYIGTPFYITGNNGNEDKQTAVFPIIKNNEIEYTLQIDSSNHENIIIESYLADKLNSITIDNANVTYTENDITISNPTYISENSKSAQKSINTKNILQPSAVTLPNDTIPEFEKKVIPTFKARERQFDLPWCGFYVMAAALNTMENKELTNASKIIHGAYPKATDDQLKNDSYIGTLDYNLAINYLKKTYGYSSILENKQLNKQTRNAYIDKNVPYAMDLKTPNASAHSILGIGYVSPKDSTLDDFIIAWNPWWEQTFMFSSKQANNLNLQNHNYTWYRTLHNFKK